MPSLEPLDFSQPENKMSLYADAERKKLLPKNDYKETRWFRCNLCEILVSENQLETHICEA